MMSGRDSSVCPTARLMERMNDVAFRPNAISLALRGSPLGSLLGLIGPLDRQPSRGPRAVAAPYQQPGPPATGFEQHGRIASR